MAKLCTLLLAVVVVLSLHASPIACTRKLKKPKPKPVSYGRPVTAAKPKPKPVSYKPAPVAAKRPRSNHTATPTPSTIVYGPGGWLSGAGATYYGATNGDGSDG